MNNFRIRDHLTFSDKILIGGLLVLSLVSYPLVRNIAQTGNSIQIETDGKLYRILSLHTDQTLAVPGPLGDTMLVIREGEAHVDDSPCRAKICVRTGHISHTGQLIVCVPNKVVVRVTGEENTSYDAVTQ